jgi:hypothetical protein
MIGTTKTGALILALGIILIAVNQTLTTRVAILAPASIILVGVGAGMVVWGMRTAIDKVIAAFKK